MYRISISLVVLKEVEALEKIESDRQQECEHIYVFHIPIYI